MQREEMRVFRSVLLLRAAGPKCGRFGALPGVAFLLWAASGEMPPVLVPAGQVCLQLSAEPTGKVGGAASPLDPPLLAAS